ncbi:MAG: DUF6174 domain-containing protein [Pirellulaceae bacterium]|nr:DUF6174 domain-containing protein [Pirellulaceae bacterium]
MKIIIGIGLFAIIAISCTSDVAREVESVEYACTSTEIKHDHIRASRGFDPPLQSRTSGAKSICAFSVDVVQVGLAYEQIGIPEPRDRFTRLVSIEPPSQTVEFPIDTEPLATDLNLGTYRRKAFAVTSAGEKVPLELANDGEDVSMVVVENLSHAQNDLDAALEKWRRTNYRDYSFTLERSCFCPGSGRFRLKIEGRVVAKATFEGSDRLPGGQLFTIRDLFEKIQSAIDDRFSEVDVAYDEFLGYPIAMSFDTNRNTIDDELRMSTWDFVPEFP